MASDTNTVIESIGVYIPPNAYSTDQIITQCDNKFRFPLEKISGIKSRRMAGIEEFSLDLAKKAIKDCLAHSNYDVGDIDLLICCNISRFDGPDRVSFEPSSAVRLRKYFGFDNAIVFDITNACAGMFTGIHIVNNLLKTQVIKRAMVVSGEYITHLAKSAQKEILDFMDDRLACLTLGDAGAAVILEESPSNQYGFEALDIQTIGKYSNLCIAKASEHGGWIMHTDSVRLTDSGIKSGSHHSLKTLNKAGWSVEDFDFLILHQTSKMTINSAKKEINKLLNQTILDENNTINNLEERGNTASTSHIVALYDNILNHKINSGDRLIFGIVASGLTLGTGLYIVDDLPDRMHDRNFINGSGNTKDKINLASHSKGIYSHKVKIESIGTIKEKDPIIKGSMEMLERVANNSLNQSSLDKEEIDLLIYAGVYRDDYLLEPAYAALLAGKLDINYSSSEQKANNFLAFDIFNGAIGFLNACFVAQQMILSEEYNTAMVVASECENNSVISANELIGLREVASSIILVKDNYNEKGFSNFMFSYNTNNLDDYITYCSTENIIPYLKINKNFDPIKAYLDNVDVIVQKLLIKEGIELNQIDLVFPPQISSEFVEGLSKRLNFPKAQFIDVAGSGPDFFSSSLPYALKHAYENNLVNEGSKGLVIAVGSGFQTACAIYHF